MLLLIRDIRTAAYLLLPMGERVLRLGGDLLSLEGGDLRRLMGDLDLL